MKDFIRQRLKEAINASEAYRDDNAIQTVIDGKRDLGFITLRGSTISEKTFWEMINNNGLKTISVPSNEYKAYIYFRKGAENKAKELWDIAEKYDGYLSYNATPEDSRRIGQLLDYKESDIEDYITKNLASRNKSMVENSKGIRNACNTMSVATWKEGYKLIVNAIGTPEQNPQMWKKIETPLKNWKEADINIGREVQNMGMSGDSMVDESNTWWSAIQSSICQ